jgi:NAD(P)H-hydrate epimerase
MVHTGSPGVGADEHPLGEAVAVGLPAAGWDVTVAGELARFRALALGPGLGRTDGVREGVRRLLSTTTVAAVVDADGLWALGGAAEAAAVVGARPAGAGPVVLTPHDGEFARLAGAPAGEDRIGSVRDLAVATGAVVLLKGPTTVVADPAGAVLLAAAGDARLATPGTGDVLTGVVAALLAGGLDGLRAAALGAHVHGRAALLGPPVGLVAGDLPDLLPRVLGGPARAEGHP